MGYNNHKIQTELSVPFKWEKQPGIAKNLVKPSKDQQDTDNVCEWHLHLEKSLLLNLPPPPGACGSGALEKPKEDDDDDDDDGLLLPLPPCVYDHKATGRSTAKRCASRKQDRFVEDPFRVAFEECTKKGYSTKLLDGRDGAAGRTRKNDKKKKKAGSWRDVLISVDFSCKRTSTNVMKSHMRMPS